MKYKVTVDTQEKKLVEVTVSSQEVDELLPAAYELVALDNAIPVEMAPPQEGVDAVLGKKAAVDAVGAAIMDHYAAIIAAEESVQTITAPTLRQNAPILKGSDYVFVITFLGKPMASLSSYEPVSIRLPQFVVHDEDIENAITSIIDEYAEYEAISDNVCLPKLGDRVEIKMESYNQGALYKPLCFDRRPYELGERFLPEPFEDALSTMAIGETRELSFCIPSFCDQGEECLNLELTATVTVLSLARKKLPNLTDEWVRANIPDAGDLQGLRAFVREDLTQGLESQIEETKQAACLYALTDRLETTLDDELLNSAYEAGFADIKDKLLEEGLTLEEYLSKNGLNKEQYEIQVMTATREQIRQALALDALAENKGFEVTQADYNDVFTMMAPGNETSMKQEFEGTPRMFQIEEMALRMKTIKWLCDTAKVL